MSRLMTIGIRVMAVAVAGYTLIGLGTVGVDAVRGIKSMCSKKEAKGA